MRGAGPVLACLLQLSAAMIELVVLGGVLSGLLALCCPAWAWLRSQRFEAYLATRAKEVRDFALQPRDKPRPIRLRDLPGAAGVMAWHALHTAWPVLSKSLVVQI